MSALNQPALCVPCYVLGLGEEAPAFLGLLGWLRVCVGREQGPYTYSCARGQCCWDSEEGEVLSIAGT